MNFITRNLKHIAAVTAAAAIGLTATAAFGQDKAKGDHYKSKSFCTNQNWSDDDRVSINDLREVTIPASGSIAVDGGQNGGISVKGENRTDVLVRACVQAWGRTDEAARAVAAGIRIGTSGGTIKAENTADDKNWSVSFQLLVPRATNLNLTARNGGISIAGVDGSAEFETRNGGVNLKDVSGSFKGVTTNGGVNVSLAGTSWRGSGLDVTTTNGGVNITMPANYAARVETGTVNGGFKSNIPALNVEKSDDEGYGRRAKRITADINGGGAPIRVVTTNGGVRINSSSE